METFLIEGHGVVLDGHTVGKAQAREAAREFLVSDAGYTEADADAVTDLASVARAWWGNEEVGFVGETWEADGQGATPVTVVNLNLVGMA